MQSKIIEFMVCVISFFIFETVWYTIDNIHTNWLRKGLHAVVITILLIIWLLL